MRIRREAQESQSKKEKATQRIAKANVKRSATNDIGGKKPVKKKGGKKKGKRAGK